jgi:Uma2 family endonuclease
MVVKAPALPRVLPPTLLLSGLHRLSLDQYRRMVSAGILSRKDRCELIRGWLVEKMAENPPHTICSCKLNKLLVRMLGDDWALRSDKPIELVHSESCPEPDFVVATGEDDAYSSRHPRDGEILLVVEIADTSVNLDQELMLPIYALEKIPVYWIVNLIDRRVEVYTQPRGGKKPTYRTRTDYPPGGSVPVVLGGAEVGSIAVDEILPKS